MEGKMTELHEGEWWESSTREAVVAQLSRNDFLGQDGLDAVVKIYLCLRQKSVTLVSNRVMLDTWSSYVSLEEYLLPISDWEVLKDSRICAR
jgi:hypothetical protein